MSGIQFKEDQNNMNPENVKNDQEPIMDLNHQGEGQNNPELNRRINDDSDPEVLYNNEENFNAKENEKVFETLDEENSITKIEAKQDIKIGKVDDFIKSEEEKLKGDFANLNINIQEGLNKNNQNNLIMKVEEKKEDNEILLENFQLDLEDENKPLIKKENAKEEKKQDEEKYELISELPKPIQVTENEWKKYCNSIQKRIEEEIKPKSAEEESKLLMLIQNIEQGKKSVDMKNIFSFNTIDISSNNLLFTFILRDIDVIKLTYSDYELRYLYAQIQRKAVENKLSILALLLLIKIYFFSSHNLEALRICEQIERYVYVSQEVLTWKGIIYLSQYINTTDINGKLENLKNAEKSFIQSLINKKYTILSLWGLLLISIEFKYRKFAIYKINPQNSPEKYASEIMKMDKYLGYLAWLEILSGRKGKDNDDEDFPQIFKEIRKIDPSRHEAYFEEFLYYDTKNDKETCLKVAKKLFTKVTQLSSQNLNNAIIMMYANALIKVKKPTIGLEIFLNQFSVNPHIPIFLFLFAKNIYHLKFTKYYGAALSALEECQSACLRDRQGQICYLMGMIYRENLEPIKSLFYLQKALKFLPSVSSSKYSLAKKLIQDNSNILEAVVDLEADIFNVMKNPNKAKIMKDKKDFYTVCIRKINGVDKVLAQLLEELIEFYVEEKDKLPINSLNELIQLNSSKLGIHAELWKIYKKKFDLKGMEKVSKLMLEASKKNSSAIPGSQYILSFILYAKTILYSTNSTNSKNISQAISVLMSLSDTIHPEFKNSNFIPFPEIFDFINFQNFQNFQNYQNFQNFQNFQTKEALPPNAKEFNLELNLFAESSPINLNEPKKKGSNILEFEFDKNPENNQCLSPTKEKVTSSYIDYQTKLSNSNAKSQSKSKPKFNSNSNSNLNTNSDFGLNSQNLRSASVSQERVQAMLNSIGKKEKWITTIENLSTNTDYQTENYLVTSNFDYLYLIGKISIQTGFDISLGLKSLINFLYLQNNLTFNFNLNLSKDQNVIRKELKSKFWIGIGLYYTGHINTAKSLFQKINPELKKHQEIKKYNKIIQLMKN